MVSEILVVNQFLVAGPRCGR